MQLTPRYGGPPVITVDALSVDPSEPLIRQRRRLADSLAGLQPDQWAAPSRCAGWSVQDVVSHLVTTNLFWTASIKAGLAGQPTRFLADFDPVASPAQIVDGLRGTPAPETLARYRDSTEAMAAVIGGLGEQEWLQIAEAPPGHLALRAVACHALWDAWIHERDILEPLGRTLPVEGDEIACCLGYAAALGPALAATTGSTRPGRLGVAATDPDVSFVVEIGPSVVVREATVPAGMACLVGPAVALVEGLSFRQPLHHRLDSPDAWMVTGLDAVFDQARPS